MLFFALLQLVCDWFASNATFSARELVAELTVGLMDILHSDVSSPPFHGVAFPILPPLPPRLSTKPSTLLPLHEKKGR